MGGPATPAAGPDLQESAVGAPFSTLPLLLSERAHSQFKGQKKTCAEDKTPEGQQSQEKSEKSLNVSHTASCGHGSYTDDLEGLTCPPFLFGTYLPTINLIVLVQTPFKARARDTATRQNRQTGQ